ncbi:MAG TPA: hypothetical protein VIV66_00590 [Pyrinomonadaceae bacterium]
MKKLGRQQWFVLAGLLLVLLFTGFFAVRTVQRAAYWHRHRDERIRPWMSIGYIARSYRVPPQVLYAALGLPPKKDRRPLKEIAREQNRPVDDVITTLEKAIAEERLNHAPPLRPPDRERSP